MIPAEITGPNAFHRAQHMARFGHRDWIWWVDGSGVEHADRRSPENIKKILLAVGTQGTWALVHRSDASPMRGFWAMGINILRQSRRGL